MGVVTGLDRDVEEAQRTLIARFAPDTRVRRVRWSRGETQVLELGDGPPLLLFHGAMSDACSWVPILPELAKTRRVLAVDLPGHGLADPFDYASMDMFELARTFLQEVLDAFQLPTVDIVANSTGGLWSVVFAIDNPDRVSRLALVGAPLGVNLSAPVQFRVLARVVRLPIVGRSLARRMISIPDREKDRKFFGQLLVVHPERLDDALLDADVVGARRNAASHISLWRSMADAKGGLILGERWQALNVPTLLLWGERDRFFGGPSEGEALAALNPNLRVIRIPDAGHIVWIDAPDTVVDEIERFLGSEVVRRR